MFIFLKMIEYISTILNQIYLGMKCNNLSISITILKYIHLWKQVFYSSWLLPSPCLTSLFPSKRINIQKLCPQPNWAAVFLPLWLLHPGLPHLYLR